MQLWIQPQSISRSHWQYVTHDSSSWKRHAHLWTLHNRRGSPRRFTWKSSLCHYIQPFTNTGGGDTWCSALLCSLLLTNWSSMELIFKGCSANVAFYKSGTRPVWREPATLWGVFSYLEESLQLSEQVAPIRSSSAARHGCTAGSVRRISCLQLQVWKLIWWREKNEDQQISLDQTEKPLQMWTI